MFSVIPAITADLDLARVDYHHLSQQTLMELLVQFFEDTCDLRDANGSYRDIKEWKGVHLNDHNEVLEIHWNLRRQNFVRSGSIDLQWIPPTVEKFWLTETKSIKGTVDFSAIPRALREINIDSNMFTGTIDFSHAPDNMEALSLGNNQLSGTVNFAKLPRSVQRLGLTENKFRGTIDVSFLCDGLQSISITDNGFTGSIDLYALPQSMKQIEFGRNSLTGGVDLTALSETIETLNLARNSLTGTLNLTTLSLSIRYLHLQYNHFSGTVGIARFPERCMGIYLQGNNLSGYIQLEIPWALILREVKCTDNAFEFPIDEFHASLMVIDSANVKESEKPPDAHGRISKFVLLPNPHH